MEITNADKSNKISHISYDWRSELKRLVWFAILAPVLVLLLVFSQSAPATEFLYSQGLFLLFSNVLNGLFGLFPFSVVELLLYLAVFGVPLSLITLTLLAIKKRVRWIKFAHLAITYILTVCILFCSFYMLWGFNYYRQPIKVLLSLDVRARTVDELESLCYMLADSAKVLRTGISEDENGVFQIDGGYRAALNSIPAAYNAMRQHISLAERTIASPKPVFYSEGLSVLGIAGIYVPFTAEANVNVHQPDLLIPSSAAHEAAHSLGIARENEANFVAYLACINSDSLAMQYSGVMLALIHCGNALSDADMDTYKELRKTYSDAINRDLEHYSAYWKAYEGPAADSMEKVNDTYLKFNNQESGVKSYGEMVDLMLAWYANNG